MEVVKRGLEGCIDVVDEEALYYDKCQKEWILKKKISNKHSGRPQSPNVKCCQRCNNKFEPITFTFQMLQSKMKNFSGNLV